MSPSCQIATSPASQDEPEQLLIFGCTFDSNIRIPEGTETEKATSFLVVPS